MIEICALGDVHLDKLRKYWPNANTLQLNAYRRVITRQRSAGIEHFVICGDVADGIRDSTNNAMRLTEEGQCELLKFLMDVDGKANLHVILGNHDWAETGSHSLHVFLTMQERGMFKTIRFYAEPEIVVIDGVRVNFLPFPHHKPTGPCDVAVAHYEVNGTISDSGQVIKFKDDRDDDYGVPFLQGHLHTKQKKGRHYYGGTLYQTSFGESLPKGYALARVGRGKKFGWKFVQEEPPFKLINAHIYKRADLKQLVSDPLTLYKLYVSDDVTIPENLLEKFPNIVNRLDFSSEEELKELEQAEYAMENSVIEVNVDDYLPKFFKDYGATDKQSKRAFEIIKEMGGVRANA